MCFPASSGYCEELIKRGISQKDVSKMLGITPPAVIPVCLEEEGLQYRVQRGYQEAIGGLAEDLIDGKVDELVKRICDNLLHASR